MAIDKSIELIKSGKAAGLVTGPISKENLHLSGIHYSGHTEILENLARRYFNVHCQADMLFVFRAFRMLLLTRHVPLGEVSQALNLPTVEASLENLVRFLQTRQKIPAPRLALMGVNPHAGEIGGNEEKHILRPAIDAINQRFGLSIPEPFPADALFRGFDINAVPYDAYVAAYHDQGLIPFKLVAGLQAVNVTIGLPFLRTSVSHGTAPDIVGQGIADPGSLKEAIRQAASMM
jgi:4-hydroxythreonine-4-phosphate dehydrogenase